MNNSGGGAPKCEPRLECRILNWGCRMIVFWTLTTSHSGLKVWSVISGALVVSVLKASLVLAQLTPAITPTTGPGGLGTTVTQAGTTYQITGGTRPGSGPNLFHSFGEFGVPTNHLANFLNDTALPTSNILGRVTGGNPPTSSGPSKPPASAAPICS